eukprot:3109585-Ditylum_brightwellii.AAC.1
MGGKEVGHLRVYFQNVNGIAVEEDMQEYMEEMKDREGDIWGWTETNANWTPNLINNATYEGQTLFNNFKIITSSSNNPAGFYQQRGTCMGMTNKMMGRIITTDKDTSGLGCWSYATIAGKDQKQVTILTAYRP